ncbi:MAG: hypothetical protein A2V69_03610 [Candidatus Portnoybacteria bacterium RBG_13_40_8]|uniref:Uncharacterized protein n=1 Tax=Candidatus Portnoybacteria bacterium RBG_13_40_8 TaxID=1801990 RepID=A0A1G2F1Z6_9BACT|nr:MAG: hypothetical protein A2V69_03610 [Candidatus Portnoybacteria bacterium RBG_13_40_8]
MNKKFFVIVIAIIIIMVAVYLIMYFTTPKNQEGQKSIQEQACIDAGGTVTMANCCQSASDFPNFCAIGPCGCASEYSHEIKICECPDGCWDGTKCVKQQTGIDTSDWRTYTNSRYVYNMQYPRDWTVKHDYGPNEITGEGYYESNVFSAPNGYALVFAAVPKGSDVVPIPRTGVGAGDFVDSDETINIGGTEVGIKYLVFEGKVKEIFFNDFETGGLWGRAYLSYFGEEDYRNFDMTGAEEVEIAKTILESFELVSP